MRPHAVAVAVAATVAIGAAGAATMALPHGPREGGPVSFVGSEEVESSYVKTPIDHLVVFGANVLRNHGDSPVTLRRGSLTDALGSSGDSPTGARVVEVRVMDPRASDNELVGAAHWPYEQFHALSQPVNGYVLAPGDEAAVLFIVRPVRTGQWQWRTTRIRYTAGGREFEASSKSGFTVCAPLSRPCEPKLH